MMPLIVPAENPLISAAANMSTGHTVLAVILGVCALASALGVAFSRRAVHAAIYMVGVMISLSMMYFSLEAEFLGAVQIIVYTGAIMMLFLFVIMLVGVRAIDSPAESKPVVVASVVLLGLALGIIGALAVFQTSLGKVSGMAEANAATNPTALALTMFQDHYFAMELVATLLIVAALGAMTLTHADRLLPKVTQPFLVHQRMEAYARSGKHPGQLPPPGVYAESNAIDVPALSGETNAPVPESLPRVVQVRGEGRALGEVSPWTAGQMRSGTLHGAGARLEESGEWGMPGPGAPELPGLLAGEPSAAPDPGGTQNPQLGGADAASETPKKEEAPK